MRRLHDTDRSARWLLIYLVIVLGWAAVIGFAIWSYGVLIVDRPEGQHTEGFEGLGWAALVYIFGGFWSLSSLAGFIVMVAICNKPGSVGPNRYGPDPRQPEVEIGGSSIL